jgi:hypothetical protein
VLHRLAAKSREVISKNLPFEEGWRAEKRKPLVPRFLAETRRAPLGAPHALK